jgi:FtsP/CotA-like multicopper oxidase with cupredoxin domain
MSNVTFRGALESQSIPLAHLNLQRRLQMFRRLAVLGITAAGLLSVSSGQTGETLRTPPGATSTTRTYYIAADEVDWNYAPAEMDHMTGKPYDQRARLFVENDAGHIGRIFKKAVYREYTDASFTKLKPRGPEWEHLGIVGPVMRGESGDTLKIVFRNNAHFPFSMHPHGVRYDQASDGVKGIPPGESFTYTWILDPRTAPKAGEPSSKLWLYHSHANERRDLAAGLVGAIIVSAKGATKADGTPKDVDREFVAIFYTGDENQSWYLTENIAKYISDSKNLEKNTQFAFRDIDGERVNMSFAGANLRETINGYIFGNASGFTMKQGEKVRWYMAAMGGVHTAHWHANTVMLDQRAADVVPLLPAEMHTVDMVAENPGMWMFHCHVEGHLATGMYTHYMVEPAETLSQARR